jgi:hypothetical protein
MNSTIHNETTNNDLQEGGFKKSQQGILEQIRLEIGNCANCLPVDNLAAMGQASQLTSFVLAISGIESDR